MKLNIQKINKKEMQEHVVALLEGCQRSYIANLIKLRGNDNAKRQAIHNRMKLDIAFNPEEIRILIDFFEDKLKRLETLKNLVNGKENDND